MQNLPVLPSQKSFYDSSGLAGSKNLDNRKLVRNINVYKFYMAGNLVIKTIFLFLTLSPIITLHYANFACVAIY
jgi:hypothetical protein